MRFKQRRRLKLLVYAFLSFILSSLFMASVNAIGVNDKFVRVKPSKRCVVENSYQELATENINQCKEKCVEDFLCQGIQFDDDKKECSLYDEHIDKVGLLVFLFLMIISHLHVQL